MARETLSVIEGFPDSINNSLLYRSNNRIKLMSYDVNFTFRQEYFAFK